MAVKKNLAKAGFREFLPDLPAKNDPQKCRQQRNQGSHAKIRGQKMVAFECQGEGKGRGRKEHAHGLDQHGLGQADRLQKQDARDKERSRHAREDAVRGPEYRAGPDFVPGWN